MNACTTKARRIFRFASALALFAISLQSFSAQVKFAREFAPEEGFTNRYEKPFRDEICLNGRWQLEPSSDFSIPDDYPSTSITWDPVPIKIPSPWNINSFRMHEGVQGGDFRSFPSYSKSWETADAAWMRKVATVPKTWRGQRVVLHFGAIAGKAVVFVNHKKVGDGFDIFFPLDVDVTSSLHYGAENEILIKVVAPKKFDQPGQYGHREYLAGSFWGSSIAGIWQDVFLEAKPLVRAEDVFVQPLVNEDRLALQATLVNDSAKPVRVKPQGQIRKWLNGSGASVLDAPEVRWKLAGVASLVMNGPEVTLQPGETKQITFSTRVSGRLSQWSPDHPELYAALLQLSAANRGIDCKYQRFGWRQFQTVGQKLLLNGSPIHLAGDSWHFMGAPQMTRRYAYAWYRLLHDAGANAVRLHASVYPSFYHDMADEMGMIILDESAIWLSDGASKLDSELYWKNCNEHVKKLVLRDRNHPSVFGWSVENEILPVINGGWHVPRPFLDHVLTQINGWKEICQNNDPTRNWISGDGEWDAEGRLPVINIHYGGEDSLKRAKESGKPWAVGETSMAYYGTPKHLAQFNGNEAYTSDWGKMNGLAYECYGLLHDQMKYGANYRSVFNLAWYSVQPLPFGLEHVASGPAQADGIWFGPYREGVPGMQPERLGPYTSTLNPGYDPSLPLYRPWPMFYAIRDANKGVENSKWADKPATSPTISSQKGADVKGESVYYLPGNGESIARELSKIGVTALPFDANLTPRRLVLDGSAPAPSPEPVSAVLKLGGSVWVWNVSPSGASWVSKLVGEKLISAPRASSSFVVKSHDPLLQGIDNASLYFSESEDWKQMDYAFSSDVRVLVESCPADWRKWNYQDEAVKTAALYRSEVERPGPRAAVGVKEIGGGRVILCNLVPEVLSEQKFRVVSDLLMNDGIEVKARTEKNRFLTFDGRIRRALISSSTGFTDPHQAYSDELKISQPTEGGDWTTRESDASGVFDFKSYPVTGPTSYASVDVALWIKSSKPLNDLLYEPNQPKVSFTYGCDDGAQVWLNGQRIANQERVGPLDPNGFTISALPLKLGWNLLVVKVVQIDGEWKFSGKFGSSDWNFLQTLEYSVKAPEGR